MIFDRTRASPSGDTLKGTTRLTKSARITTGLAMAAVSVLSLVLAPVASAQDTQVASAPAGAGARPAHGVGKRRRDRQ